ncbi:MAG: 2-dehydropantoate 2-reductase [Ectothiorhodospiraceae bacterium]|nr:2-dehydropantoate 2-reductase [Ectothiorhodospiraceae bacterium]
MHIAVIGAGGVGAFYGARWQQGGNAVVFVARGKHLEALQTRGMQITHPELSFNNNVEAMDIDEFLKNDPGRFDLVALAVKSAATREVGQQLARWFHTHGTRVPVISLQNGVDNEQMLAELLGPECVIGGIALRIGTHVEAPGVIVATGPGQLVTGLWPNRDQAVPGPAAQVFPELVRMAEASATPVIPSDDIRRELWRKLAINNGVNPISALTGWDTGRLSHTEETAAIIRRLMREAASVARADGVILGESDVDEMFRLVYELEPIKTSMLVDREHGRPLELDAICGAVIRRGRALGEDVPATEMMDGLLRHGIWVGGNPA